MGTKYVNTASTTGGDGSTNNTSGLTRAFASVDDAMVWFEANSPLSEQWTVYCTGSTADTVARSINVDIGTSATNYVLFTTQGSDRHEGVWDASKYRLSITNADSPFYLNAANHVRIDGLQMEMISTTADEFILVKPSNANQTGNGKDLRVSNCILRSNNPTTGTTVGIECRPFGSGSGEVYIWNNIVYGFTSGIRCEAGPPTAKLYNNTVYDCEYNIYANSTSACIAVNNLSAAGGTTDFLAGGSFASGTQYNASSDGSAPGTNSRTSQTFTFVDSANKDFHLTSGDAGARNFGLSDPGSGLFSDDIDGETRSGSWDIGADEYVAAATASGARKLPLMGVA